MIERNTKETLIFSILNDRTKRKLIPFVKNNIIANNLGNEDEYPEDNLINTRIFSNCFSSYQPADFRNI